MKSLHTSRAPLHSLLILSAWIGVTVAAHAQIHTNWAAYNDHRPSTVPVASGWKITAPNVTGFDMGAPADAGGSLIDFFTGQTLPASVTFTRSGAPNDFPTVTRPIPTNTPAAQIFYGICDLSNDGIVGVDTVGEVTNSVIITFSGLDPSKHYLFRGTGARNGGYAPRWTVATISADNWVDAHLNGTGPGVITSNNFPNTLGAGQAAWNSGHNAQGAVVGWDFIAPHFDGTFTIVTEQYIGPTPNGGQALIDNYGYSFGACLLAEVEVAPPVITTSPTPVVNVEQNRPFSLSVAASGTPLLYQWYKEGSGKIAGATFPTFSVAKAAVADSGRYYAVVYNPLANATSSVSQVNVSADTTAPTVAAAISYPTVDPTGLSAAMDQIILEFNETVAAASVSSPDSYTVPGGGHPLSVIVTNDRTVVLLLGTPLAENTDYTVTTTGARDEVGNVAGSKTTSFHSWVSGIGNGLLFEAFSAGAGVEVDTLLASPNYPDNAFLRANLPIFDTRVVFPDDTQEQYGGRIRGVFIPPVSGNWSFFMRTFDRGVVYFNPNGTDPDGKQEILRESTGNPPRNWDKFSSSLFALRAGQPYYIEALYKADTGVDVMKVAARLQGTGVPTPVDTPDAMVDPNSVGGAFVGFPLAPRDLGGSLTIQEDLANVTAEELNPAVFSLKLNNPSLLPLQYQWYRDGAPISGANGPTYTIQPTIAVDQGATFSVQVAKPGSVVTSRTATLTVIRDTHPPRIIQVTSSPTNLSSIVLKFNEIVNGQEAADFLNYALSGNIGVTLATLEADGQTVTLTLSMDMVANDSYQLQVSNVRDLSDLTIDPNPTTVTFTAGLADLPKLDIARAGNDVTLSWPAASAGFTLEQTDQLQTPTAVWTAVGTPPTVVNGRNTVTVGASGGAKMFRLHQ